MLPSERLSARPESSSAVCVRCSDSVPVGEALTTTAERRSGVKRSAIATRTSSPDSGTRTTAWPGLNPMSVTLR